ncbi:MAG: cyclic nucleotide-binding domain-containing protein [Anaerolineae bacterium]|nr:cyclic nucleotide-binding domain-containing protein [Anaerolineae bacterium]NIN99795.1 cyclic nucleotide-binding domain-containing protein [Anaerolineae bacterium]NIQ78671.1 cyclic nucleotide-binding domain-containing protein [Anaerolineae bacterium]
MPLSVRTKVGYLKTVDIFQDLTDQELEALESSITTIPCAAGKIFYAPEDAGEALFILKEGKVQLYRISPDGRKIVTNTLGPGTIFGEMSLIGQGMYDSFAEATEQCAVCKMDRADLEELLLEKPRVALRILEVISRRLLEVEARLEDMAFKTVAGRLASLLLRLMREQGTTIRGLTHQNLADDIGTHRETTTQTLSRFKADGLLETGRKRIEILDPDGLQRIANEC